MILLSAIVAGTSAAVALSGVLVRQGFRHGDVRCDARVRARVLAAAHPPVPAGWVEVTITNPSSATALVALALRPVRFARMSTAVQRRTGGRRVRLTLSDKVLGAVAPEQADRFWLWADADPRRLRLHVAVGLPGRLRLHRLPLPDAEPDGDRRGRAQVDDPRAPSAT